jgi:hypothetical protein
MRIADHPSGEVHVLHLDPKRFAHSTAGECDEREERVAAFGQVTARRSRSVRACRFE